MSTNDLQPDLEEVLQAEEASYNEETPVAVMITGPVRTQRLPDKAGTTKTVLNVGTVPQRMLQADHRRSNVQLLSTGGAMRVAFNVASKEDPSRMALWPVAVPLHYQGDDEIWVAADAGTITVTVIASYWAVGEDGGS